MSGLTASILLECRRQSRLAAKADLADADLLDVMDDALADVESWTA
ncbi:antitoxin MazE-like protein [uncultured Thiocystis sp.]|nr:antitoxin MazE-like protein [uncultured Thiocystis sp.]